jgi:putative PIN family toxin of toxin-antitoxin system
MSFDWKNERVVPDTNFLVSALLFEDGWAGLAFKLIAESGTLLCSDDTLTELTEVFARPKFDPFCSRESRMGMLYDTIRVMTKVQVLEEIRACRDPKDDKFLSLAVAGNARVIISGDKDLLVLHPFRGVQILSPRDYIMID